MTLDLNNGYPYLMIEWKVGVSRMGLLSSGSRCGTDRLGQYKTYGKMVSLLHSAYFIGERLYFLGLMLPFISKFNCLIYRPCRPL